MGTEYGLACAKCGTWAQDKRKRADDRIRALVKALPVLELLWATSAYTEDAVDLVDGCALSGIGAVAFVREHGRCGDLRLTDCYGSSEPLDVPPPLTPPRPGA